jgi:hypothetical protein
MKNPLSLLALVAVSASLLSGCSSATTTAYQADSVALATLQAAASGWNAYAKSHTVDVATEAKVQSLFTSAKSAYVLAVDASEVAAGFETNSTSVSPSAANAALTQSLSDLTAFLKTVGVSL